jgi:hypothetical protein
MAARAGQVLDLENVPHTIQDYIWDVLEAHRNEFPYQPQVHRGGVVQPWRMHWMAR